MLFDRSALLRRACVSKFFPRTRWNCVALIALAAFTAEGRSSCLQARQLSVFSLDAIKVRAAKCLFGQIACRSRASKHAGGKSSELAGVIHRMGGVFNSSSESMGCAGGKKTF